MNQTAIFTISSNNYFAFSRTLLESVKKHHDDADLFFLLVDEEADSQVTSVAAGLCAVIPVKEIGIPDFQKMAFQYDIVELNTAVKPFVIDHLFKKGYHKVLYLDPDILVCGRLDSAIDALTDHALVLTPHQLSPVIPLSGYTSYLPWEQAALETGIFNLGFIGVSNTPEGRSFIAWWSNRCRFLCYVEPAAGLFVDQKWVDLVPCYFPSVHILRDRGYNMSAWNLHDRRLVNGRVNDAEPLVFYHFSSIDMQNDDLITRHDASMQLRDRPDLLELFRSYRQSVRRNGYDYFRALPYSYASFADGRKIELLERRLFAALADLVPDPFGVPSGQFGRVLRAARRSRSDPHVRKRDGTAKRLTKSCLRTAYRFLGARWYARLVLTFRRNERFRSHVFLID